MLPGGRDGGGHDPKYEIMLSSAGEVTTEGKMPKTSSAKACVLIIYQEGKRRRGYAAH